MRTEQLDAGTEDGVRPSWVDYLRVARPDHWFKNVFMLAGVAAALIYTHRTPDVVLLGYVVLAFWATCCVASFNYIINEILDAPTDLHHPRKKYRPIPAGRVKIGWLMVLAVLFLLCGLGIAASLYT